jgi:nitronate monooxygenase
MGLDATFTLVPEIADYLSGAAPDTVLVAGGGIGDGRGLAAALMLGADGVLIGTRFLASTEALVAQSVHAAVLAADGDSTIRTRVVDIARRIDWPEPFTGRVLKTRFWTGAAARQRSRNQQSLNAKRPATGTPRTPATLIMPVCSPGRRSA